jgi:hypothetical protein
MGISSALGSSAFTPAALGFRNKIINGDFRVWQRGTTITDPTSTNYYCADRWGLYRLTDAVGATVSRSTDVPTGFQYSLKMQRTAGNTSTRRFFLGYALETADSIPLIGQRVVLSFYIKAGANYTGTGLIADILTGTGVDQRQQSMTGRANLGTSTVNPTSSWQRIFVYGTAPVSASVTQLALQFAWSPNALPAGADDSVYITGVQLEANYNSPTLFEQRPVGVELALCQRYCFAPASGGANDYPRIRCSYYSGTYAQHFISTPVPMRANPNLIGTMNTAYRVFDAVGGTGRTISVKENFLSQNGITVGFVMSTTATDQTVAFSNSSIAYFEAEF